MKIKSENQKRESKAIWPVTVVMAVCLISGCSSMGLQPQRKADSVDTKQPGIQIISLPAELRTQTLKIAELYESEKLKTKLSYSCTEPAPDVTMSSTLKLLAQASADSAVKSNSKDANQDVSKEATNKNNASLDLQTATTALELAGRTQIVLLAREMLYRICEAGANGWLNGTQIETEHKSVIAEIGKMVESEKVTADAKKVSADAAKTSADTAVKQLQMMQQQMLQQSR